MSRFFSRLLVAPAVAGFFLLPQRGSAQVNNGSSGQSSNGQEVEIPSSLLSDLEEYSSLFSDIEEYRNILSDFEECQLIFEMYHRHIYSEQDSDLNKITEEICQDQSSISLNDLELEQIIRQIPEKYKISSEILENFSIIPKAVKTALIVRIYPYLPKPVRGKLSLVVVPYLIISLLEPEIRSYIRSYLSRFDSGNDDDDEDGDEEERE